MGEIGFHEDVRSCGFLRRSAVCCAFCEHLRLRNPLFLEKAVNQQQYAEIGKKHAKVVQFVLWFPPFI